MEIGEHLRLRVAACWLRVALGCKTLATQAIGDTGASAARRRSNCQLGHLARHLPLPQLSLCVRSQPRAVLACEQVRKSVEWAAQLSCAVALAAKCIANSSEDSLRLSLPLPLPLPDARCR